jgi:hypothetical protein
MARAALDGTQARWRERVAVHGAAAAPLLILALACAAPTPGERLASTDGGTGRAAPTCPAGETCSSLVDGLAFQRALGGPLLPIAIGGRIRIRMLTACPTTSWFCTAGPPLTLPFIARSSDERVLGIGDVDGPEVAVRGASAGSARLRILEPAGDALLDSVVMEVRAVARTRITMTSLDVAAPGEDVVAVWPGSLWQSLVQVRLEAADGTALLDDTLAPRLTQGPAPASGTVSLRVVREAGEAENTLQVDNRVRTISIATISNEGFFTALLGGEPAIAEPGLEIDEASGGQILLCFAVRGPDGPIAGAPVEVTSSDTALIAVQDSVPGCVYLLGISNGDATITASLAGLSAARLFHVSGMVAEVEPLVSAPALPEATRGERMLR